MFLLLAGGLLIILLAVVIAVVSSVVSAVAAGNDEAEDWTSGLRTVSFLRPSFSFSHLLPQYLSITLLLSVF